MGKHFKLGLPVENERMQNLYKREPKEAMVAFYETIKSCLFPNGFEDSLFFGIRYYTAFSNTKWKIHAYTKKMMKMPDDDKEYYYGWFVVQDRKPPFKTVIKKVIKRRSLKSIKTAIVKAHNETVGFDDFPLPRKRGYRKIQGKTSANG